LLYSVPINRNSNADCGCNDVIWLCAPPKRGEPHNDRRKAIARKKQTTCMHASTRSRPHARATRHRQAADPEPHSTRMYNSNKAKHTTLLCAPALRRQTRHATTSFSRPSVVLQLPSAIWLATSIEPTHPMLTSPGPAAFPPGTTAMPCLPQRVTWLSDMSPSPTPVQCTWWRVLPQYLRLHRGGYAGACE
jgi:hypothetical protein